MTTLEEEINKVNEYKTQADEVERKAILLGHFIIKTNLCAGRISKFDITGAKWLVEHGDAPPWLIAISNGNPSGNMKSLAEVARAALEDEGD